MYYNLPLFSYNVKILRFFGIIDSKNANIGRVAFVIEVVMNICQILNLVLIWHNLSIFSTCLFTTISVLSTLLRNWTLTRNQCKFIKFMKEIECWYREIELNYDEITWNVFKDLPKRTRAITNASFVIGSTSVAAVFAMPLLLEQRALPFQIYTHGLDNLKSPSYEIIYAVQTFIVLPYAFCSYVPLTNLFISWLLFGICLLQALGQKLQTIPSGNNRELLRNLKILINCHQRIIRYGQNLEKLFSFICLAEFLLFSMMLCVLLLCFLLVENIIYKITTFIFAVTIIHSIFIPYWHTNEFSTESLKLANAVYDIDWINADMEVRKCVLIFLIRCQTPLMIKAGGIYPMTLEAFRAILNGAYAYFNMFRGIMTN